MVIKGGSRGAAGELARHLQRTDTNERMEVREVRGVVVGSVTGALREMEAVSAGARSRKPFYHASINTPRNEQLSEEQKTRAINRLEDRLGLTGQPRVVVEHVKEGRAHIHIAWSRIDGETLCAIPDSHNYRKHEEVARELEQEFGHKRVQGVHHEREGQERPKRRPSLSETRQAERSGLSPEEAKAQLRELWAGADSGKSFAAALTDAGWTLAQGDKRGFVAMDPAGEARAVNKDITGLTAAKMRERLADIDAGTLPSVDEARAMRRDQAAAPEAVQERQEPAPSPEDQAWEPDQLNAPIPATPINTKLFPDEERDDSRPPATKPEPVQAVEGERLSQAANPSQAQPAAVLENPSHVDSAAEGTGEASRLRQTLDRAREALHALGERLEAAFGRVQRLIERKREAGHQPVEGSAGQPSQQASEPSASPDKAAKLSALGERLDLAFARVRETFDRHGKAEQQAAAKDQLRNTLNAYRRNWSREPGGRDI